MLFLPRRVWSTESLAAPNQRTPCSCSCRCRSWKFSRYRCCSWSIPGRCIVARWRTTKIGLLRSAMVAKSWKSQISTEQFFSKIKISCKRELLRVFFWSFFQKFWIRNFLTVATFRRLNCDLSKVQVFSMPEVSPVTIKRLGNVRIDEIEDWRVMCGFHD